MMANPLLSELGADEVLRLLEVEVSAGLGGGEVKRRREELGPD